LGAIVVVFVAQLEPTAVEPETAVGKSTAKPETAVGKSTTKPETAVGKSTTKPETAVGKSTTKPETAVGKSTAKPETAVGKSTAKPETPAEAAPAETASAKVRPTKAVTEATSAAKGRRTQSRAGRGDRRGDQTNRYLAHHDAHSIRSEHPSLSNQTRRFPLSCVVRHSRPVSRLQNPSLSAAGVRLAGTGSAHCWRGMSTHKRSARAGMV
jgi:hypothetical protein